MNESVLLLDPVYNQSQLAFNTLLHFSRLTDDVFVSKGMISFSFSEMCPFNRLSFFSATDIT